MTDEKYVVQFMLPPEPHYVREWRESPTYVTLSDGRVLFTRYWTMNTPREIHMGPMEEWCRNPDGTESRCSHFAAAMSTGPSTNETVGTPARTPKKGKLRRLWDAVMLRGGSDA